LKHCCRFKADDIYYLADTELYPQRKLSVGYCPICGKPVAELVLIRFDGKVEQNTYSGLKADEIVMKNKDSILYSVNELNYSRFKSKPFGWKYGVNKTVMIKGQEHIRQYACDFYGNKEIIKEI
jgi:hypothetical protein